MLKRYIRGAMVYRTGKVGMSFQTNCRPIFTDLTIFNSRIGNNWVSLGDDGILFVKPGYTWNGCSPKISILGMVFGTPEGEYSPNICQTTTWRASLIHDALYQLSENFEINSRKLADIEFYERLKRDGFKMARLYYWAVRLLGWRVWGRSG